MLLAEVVSPLRLIGTGDKWRILNGISLRLTAELETRLIICAKSLLLAHAILSLVLAKCARVLRGSVHA
jgi:hypothetical protein